MSLAGRLLYRFQRTFGKGVRVAYYRDVVRPRIFQTRPIENTTSQRVELHTLTSADDFPNLMWMLKSFYIHSGRDYSLCVHSDGTITADRVTEFLRHFPNARWIDRRQADARVGEMLAPYPRALDFRSRDLLSPKIFDCRHYLRAERMLFIDSDILFFREPTELLERIESPSCRRNAFNPQGFSAYTLTPEQLTEQLGWAVTPSINSGLSLIHRDSLNLDWIEQVLAVPGITNHHWRTEQTIYACISSRWGVELLPDSYLVYMDAGLRPGQACRHYVGAIRHWMYSEGMRHLVRAGFLERAQ